MVTQAEIDEVIAVEHEAADYEFETWQLQNGGFQGLTATQLSILRGAFTAGWLCARRTVMFDRLNG